METESKPVIVAITGASGALWGITLITKILSAKSGPAVPLMVLISTTGKTVVEKETGKSWNFWLDEFQKIGNISTWPVDDFSAPVASGSSVFSAMVIAPCSMGTLGRIAAGISSNLIERAADVTLKERRKLVLLTRETPLSLIHINNMKIVTEAGGIIMPPVPVFYHKPETIQDIITPIVERVCDIIKLPLDGTYRWSGTDGEL